VDVLTTSDKDKALALVSQIGDKVRIEEIAPKVSGSQRNRPAPPLGGGRWEKAPAKRKSGPPLGKCRARQMAGKGHELL
jgi:hypothetical protein